MFARERLEVEPEIEDSDKVWPPAPSTTVPAEGNNPAEHSPSARPHLAVILAMWALTIGQFLLQLVAGLSFLGQLLGFCGFVLALFLVTRKEKAARINGGLRLGVALLGFLFHLLASR